MRTRWLVVAGLLSASTALPCTAARLLRLPLPLLPLPFLAARLLPLRLPFLPLALLPFARRRAHTAVSRAVSHVKNAGLDPHLEMPSSMPP